MIYYSQIRPLIKTGDMLEWKARSVVGGTIRFFTRKAVNHTSLCLDLNQYLHWQEPHKFVLEANSGGIELNLISTILQDFRGEFYWSALKPEFDHLRKDIARWALLKIGTPYDFGSLLRNAWGRVSANARRLFCSEYYFLALKSVRLVAGEKSPRPGEFEQLGVHLPAVKMEVS